MRERLSTNESTRAKDRFHPLTTDGSIEMTDPEILRRRFRELSLWNATSGHRRSFEVERWIYASPSPTIWKIGSFRFRLLETLRARRFGLPTQYSATTVIHYLDHEFPSARILRNHHDGDYQSDYDKRFRSDAIRSRFLHSQDLDPDTAICKLAYHLTSSSLWNISIPRRETTLK